MTPDAPDNEELFTRLVAAYGDALAAGQGPDPDSDPNVPHSLRPRLRRVLDCLRLVRDARPEGEPPAAGASTGTAPSGLPATVSDGATPLPADLGLYGEAVGKRVGRFVILGTLGSGGFGVVFLAFDPVLERKVALKVPRLEALLSPELRERFLREARAAAGLDHPNLVRVHEAGEADGLAYIVSAYCPGSTLGGWLKQQTEPVPPDTAARLVLRLAEAVQYVHEHGIWHRDVKPGNVLLGPATPAEDELPFTPRLTDFGLALLADRLDVTRSGLVGTPAYMAPEQTGGRVRETGPHTDVYGLGALLYEVLTKRPPFEADPADDSARKVQDILRKVQDEEPASPRKWRQDLPRDLATVCLKCLEKAPAKRYPSAGELAADLRRFLAGEPIQARPTPRLERLWRVVRKRPLRSVAAALLALALAGGLGAGYYFDPSRPRRELAAALRGGRPYVFEGDERLPGPFRQVIGDVVAPKRNAPESCFSVETLDISLWEVTGDPGCDRYRLSAKVRHDGSTGGESLIGLYFGYREHQTASGDRQAGFFTLTFADRGLHAWTEKDGAGGPLSRVQVRAHLFRLEAGKPWAPKTSVTQGAPFRPAVEKFAVPAALPWRELAVEVRPEGVKVFWANEDGVIQFKEEVPAAGLEGRLQAMKRPNPEMTGVPADYRPHSGIGLYVLGGEGSFRHVVVRPLAEGG
jgi:hypothetical protein